MYVLYMLSKSGKKRYLCKDHRLVETLCLDALDNVFVVHTLQQAEQLSKQIYARISRDLSHVQVLIEEITVEEKHIDHEDDSISIEKLDRIVDFWRGIPYIMDNMKIRLAQEPTYLTISQFLDAGHRVYRHAIFVREYILTIEDTKTQNTKAVVVSLTSSQKSPERANSLDNQINAVWAGYNQHDYILPNTYREDSILWDISTSSLIEQITVTRNPTDFYIYFNDIFARQWQKIRVPECSLLDPIIQNDYIVIVPPRRSTYDTAIMTNLICHCGQHGQNSPTMLCGGCKVPRYCSVECQQRHWPEHREACKHLKKRKKQKQRESNPVVAIDIGLCGYCQAAASKKCSRCKVIHYCSTECQRSHYTQHVSVCRAFVYYGKYVKRPTFAPFPLGRDVAL